MKSTKLTEFDLTESPKLRDAFCEGRTEPIKLLKTFKNVLKKENIDGLVHRCVMSIYCQN